MTDKQRIQLRMSEVRSRLNEIAAMTELSDEIRAESGQLVTELSDLETRFRAAVAAEENRPALEALPDGEGAEVRALTARASLGRSLMATANGRSIMDGPEAELRAAYGIDDPSVVPWAALAPRRRQVEDRADAATPAPSTLPRMQDEILARVFPMSAAAFLGCDMPRVGVGESSYPVLTTGTTAATVTEGTARDSTAGAFSVLNLSPLRATARYTFSVEDLAVLRGMEEALREDLSDALMDLIDREILTGDGTTSSGVTHPSGFLDASSGSLTIPSAPADVAAYSDYLAAIGGRLDGRYAHGTRDVRLLVGGSTGGHMVSILQSGSGWTAWKGVSELVGQDGLKVSGNIPAMDATSKVQHAILRRGMVRAAVCPIWEGVRLIRDEITGAASGTVAVTAIALYNFGFIRTDEFAIASFKVAA